MFEGREREREREKKNWKEILFSFKIQCVCVWGGGVIGAVCTYG